MILVSYGIEVLLIKFDSGPYVKSYDWSKKNVRIVIFCYKPGHDINQLKLSGNLAYT